MGDMFTSLPLFEDLYLEDTFGEEETPSEQLIAEVALDLPLYETYHYIVPTYLHDRAQPGMRVLAPVGGRRLTGYLLRFSPPPEGIKLREIEDILDDAPLFDEKTLELFEFCAQYLFYPLGEVIKGALPAGINVESKLLVKITETGRNASQSGLLRGPRGELLKQLASEGELPAAHLLNMTSSGRHVHLRELERDGFAELRNTLTKPRNQMKKTKLYKIVEGVSLARRTQLLKKAQKQTDVYTAIEEKGELLWPDIREAFGQVRGILRSLLRKGLIDVEEREISADPFFSPVEQRDTKPPLTEQQQKVMDTVLPGVDQKIFQPFLLHGVTGSGKTEIYMRLIEHMISLGRQAIVLVPEISLTPQFVSNFRARLGDNMTVLHSRLNERERLSQWWRIQRGEVPMVIGARSAIR
ncbi:MAG TPA: hypothetical protein DCE42_05950, partial [Myxococcales bacterium]|nr:hypothetical protein [Myxococcales bacterium]